MSYQRKSEAQVREDLRRRCGSGQRQWATDNGFSPQFVNDLLHGRRAISKAVGEALGYERVTYWRKRGKP